MSSKSQFADLETEVAKPERKRMRKPITGSPQRGGLQRRTRIREPMPVKIILNDGNANEVDSAPKLNGVVSIVFDKNAHDLREALKPLVLHDGLQVMKFHWGAMRFMNIDPLSTPKKPVLTCPPVAFVKAAAAACDSTQFCSDFSIRIGHERGRKIELPDVDKMPWDVPVRIHAHAQTHTQAHAL